MIETDISYFILALLLVLASGLAWITNFFSLPGNWFIVGLVALFVLSMGVGDAAEGLNWRTVAVLALIAAAGEVMEFAAGAAGAAKQGGSRRALALAIFGTIIGSIAGAVIGLPIPIVGPLVGALLGGAGGAFLGAYLGEMWKHGRSDKSVHVGVGAAIGRLLGTIGKLLIGAVMIVVLAVSAFSA